MPGDIGQTPFVLGFKQEPFGAVGEQGTGVRPSLQFPIETLQFLRKTTLRLLLTYQAQAREYTFAMVLFVDGTETLGIDGDAWCACCGHGTPPPVSGGAFSKAAARPGKLSTNGFLSTRSWFED